MTASPSAKFAPVGALRIGLALLVVGAFLAWGPLDDVPRWLWLAVLFAGGLLVAVGAGIRMLREP